MRYALAACLIVAVTSAAAQTFPTDTAKKKCSAEWASDFEMQAYCMDQQRLGWSQVEQQRSRLDDEMIASLENCEVQWFNDFEMISYCLQ